MKVVFLENFSEAGFLAGDIREVKDGFARNFLIPKKIALPATEKIIAGTVDLRKKGEEIREEARIAAQSIKEQLSGKVLEIYGKSDGDTLYAAVTGKIISDKINSEFGVKVEERFIKDGHIKTLGSHLISIVMNDGISLSLKVEISDSEVAKKAKSEKKSEKKEESFEEVKKETQTEESK